MTKYILPVIASPQVRSAINDLLQKAGYATIGAATTVNRALNDMRNSGNIALIVAEAQIPGTPKNGMALFRMTRGVNKSPVNGRNPNCYRSTPFILIANDPQKARKDLQAVYDAKRLEEKIPVFSADFTQTAEGRQEFLDAVAGYMQTQ